jgi:amino acid permease
LYALAWEEQAPKIFLKRHRFDIPIYALILTSLPSVLAYVAVRVSSANVSGVVLENADG